MNDQKESSKALKRQIWEPQGVVSQAHDASTVGLDYGDQPKDTPKGGQLEMEVEEVFHNRGIMENLQDSRD